MRLLAPFRPPLHALSLVALTVSLFVVAASPARAAVVKGTVRLPEGARAGRLYRGYWRVENGTVPVRTAGGKPGTVVVLEGLSGAHAPPPKTVTVEIAGLEAQPRVVVVGPGSVVEFKNVGKTTHELSTPADTSVMPIERLNPGTFRHQRFGMPGGYVVRCSEYPHLTISVLVVDSPYFAVTDDRGAFTIPGVPDGKATLKVWSLGRWVHEQAVDTGSKQDVTVRVTAKETQGQAQDKEAVKEAPGEPKDSEGKEPEGQGTAE